MKLKINNVSTINKFWKIKRTKYFLFWKFDYANPIVRVTEINRKINEIDVNYFKIKI